MPVKLYGACHNGRAYRFADSLLLGGLRGKRLERASNQSERARLRSKARQASIRAAREALAEADDIAIDLLGIARDDT